MSLTKVSFSMIEGASFNVLDFGAIGNGVVDDAGAIQAAATAAVAAGGSLYFPVGTYNILSNVSIGDTTLIFDQDAKLFVNAGFTFSFQGSVEADPIYFIFDGSGTYTGTSNVKCVSPCWFGVDATGVAECSAKFQKAIDFAYLTQVPTNISGGWEWGGCEVRVPRGRYNLGNILNMRDNIALVGEGWYSASLDFVAGTGIYNQIDALNVTHARGFLIENLVLRNSGIFTVAAYKSRIRDVHVHGATFGVKKILTVNETVESVNAFACTYGFWLSGEQGVGPSTSITLDKCHASYCDVGFNIDFTSNAITTSAMRDCLSEYNNVIGVNIAGSVEMILDNVHLEENQNNDIRIEGSPVVTILKTTYGTVTIANGTDVGRVFPRVTFIDCPELIVIVASSYTSLVEYTGGINPNSTITGSFSVTGINNIYRNTNSNDAVLPTNIMTYITGDTIMKRTPIVGQSPGWICTSSGTVGTLSGITASGLSSSTNVTLSANGGISAGDFLQIGAIYASRVGKTLNKNNWAGQTGTLLEMQNTAPSNYSGQTVQYVAPVFTPLPVI